jgi:hypothetical protein
MGTEAGMNPTDKLGNQFKAGQFVQVQLPSPVILAQVQEINPGGIIGGGPSAMPMNGRLILVAVLPLEFRPDNPIVEGVMVLQQPQGNKA